MCCMVNRWTSQLKWLDQRGPTTFDQRAILQKCDNSRATSNKMMYKTTDSQDLKLKSENTWVQWVCQWNYCKIAIKSLLHISIGAMPVASMTLSFLLKLLWHYRSCNNNNMLVVESRSLWSSASSVIRFLFVDLTCFVAENVFSHTYVLPNAERIVSAKFFSLETYLCWLISRSSVQSAHNNQC